MLRRSRRGTWKFLDTRTVDMVKAHTIRHPLLAPFSCLSFCFASVPPPSPFMEAIFIYKLGTWNIRRCWSLKFLLHPNVVRLVHISSISSSRRILWLHLIDTDLSLVQGSDRLLSHSYILLLQKRKCSKKYNTHLEHNVKIAVIILN